MNQKKITANLIKFRDDREWVPFHTVKNLAYSALLEASEIAQLYQWGKTPTVNRVAEEIADNAIYLIYLCEKYDLDLEEIILQKIAKNEIKYPVHINHAIENGWRR